MAKAKSATRRGERELAFQVLYGLSFTPASDVDDLRHIFRISPDYLARWQGQEPPVHPSGFAWELVEGVWSKSDELDASISNFSRNWRVDRMGRVELTLLRLAVYEIMFRADVPPKVAINEAIELGKRYSTQNSGAFINGILDKIMNRARPAGSAATETIAVTPALDEELPDVAAEVEREG